MIEYIKGRIDTLNPAFVVLEAGNGVAYRLSISLQTFSAIENSKDARLLVHESIREDAWILYGFATAAERDIFRLLIGVSGVGAATAMLMLSALPGGELTQAIAAADIKRLKAVKGIGAKTAERIVVDLRDKIDQSISIPASAPASRRAPEAYDEALAALVMLGFDRKSSVKVLDALFKDETALKVETAIKKALSLLK